MADDQSEKSTDVRTSGSKIVQR